MAIPLADLIAKRDALILQRLTGVSRVRDSDTSDVLYRTDAEIARVIAAIDAMITQVDTPITTLRFNTSKGI